MKSGAVYVISTEVELGLGLGMGLGFRVIK